MTEKDFVPETFGKWTTLGAPFSKQTASQRKIYVLCRCECGKEREVVLSCLQSGRSKACRSCSKVKNGWKLGCRHPDPVIRAMAWRRNNLIERCYNPKDPDYHNYGGREITVCDPWLDPIHGFDNFLKDMGLPPAPGLTIDRIDNSKGYSPENCRWATDEEQANNKRTNRPITYNDVTKNLGQWAKFLGIQKDTLRLRLEYGWSVEKAFTTPVRIKRSLTAKAAKQKPAV